MGSASASRRTESRSGWYKSLSSTCIAWMGTEGNDQSLEGHPFPGWSGWGEGFESLFLDVVPPGLTLG